jgi:hypothetical protein
LDCSSAQRRTVVQQWLARTLRTYPEESSRFFGETGDPFRNPVGRVLREGLPVLFEELAGAFDRERAALALDEILRIRAVQDFTPSQAVGFLFLLKSILREELGGGSRSPEALDRRIDELALMAFDLYVHCREKTFEIRVNEARRRVYVMERAAARQARL